MDDDSHHVRLGTDCDRRNYCCRVETFATLINNKASNFSVFQYIRNRCKRSSFDVRHTMAQIMLHTSAPQIDVPQTLVQNDTSN